MGLAVTALLLLIAAVVVAIRVAAANRRAGKRAAEAAREAARRLAAEKEIQERLERLKPKDDLEKAVAAVQGDPVRAARTVGRMMRDKGNG